MFGVVINWIEYEIYRRQIVYEVLAFYGQKYSYCGWAGGYIDMNSRRRFKYVMVF